MSDDEMAGVHPLRLAETRRRVGVIRRFLALDRPTARDRDDHAALVGVGTKHFMSMVGAWRKAGGLARPSQLPGASAGKGGRRPRRGGIASEARTAVRRAVEQLGVDASLAAVVAETNRRCIVSGVTPPGKSAVWNMQMKLRSEIGAASFARGIVVGTATIRLPVARGCGSTLPVLTVAILVPEGRIAAYSVSFDPEVSPNEDRVSADAAVASPDGDRAVERLTARALANVLGRGVGPLELLYRPQMARAASALARARRDAPLDEADAERVIREAVATHNAWRPTVTGSAARRARVRTRSRAPRGD